VVGGGALVVLAGFALSGHVVTAGPRWLTSPPLLLHAAAAAFWVGSLVPLYRALTGSPEEVGRLLQRFSFIATWAVAGLAAAGLVIAWLQVRQPEALVTTSYGRVLLAKLALVAALLGLAALNRLRLTPALVRGDADAPRQLGWSIAGEVGLVIAVLTATAALGTTPPPRALMSEAPMDTHDAHAHQEHGHGHMHGGQSLSLVGNGFEAVLLVQPGQVGPNTATVSLQDFEGQPLDVLEVTLRVSNPDRGIAPLERPAQRDSLGQWRVPKLVLAVPGEWEIELEVLVSDFERQTLTGGFDLD
jgi:copper transport protein